MSRSIRSIIVFEAILLALSGCSGPAEVTADPPATAAPVINPDTTAKAVLGGQVLDETGQPIVGATVTALATSDAAVTDANGEYLLAAEAESSLMISVSAEGYAGALVDSVMLERGTTSLGLDVRLHTVTSLEDISSKAGDAPDLETFGVIAVSVVALNPGCSAAGGTLALLPGPAAKVVYPPFGVGVDAIVAGESVDGYVVRVLPPGIYDSLELTGASCEVAPFPVSYQGRTYEGALKVEAGKLTQATLFLQ